VDKTISLILPTRGRSTLAERFMESASKCAEKPRLVEVVVYADEDDPDSHALNSSGLEITTIIGKRDSMGAYNSACYEKSRGDIIVLANDDVAVRTSGWDRKLREADSIDQDGVYLAYPNDLFKGRRLCAFPILSRRTCELLIEPFPRAYQGAFIDYHLLDIFKRLERYGYQRLRYLEDVVFEHMHFRTGKGSFDATYRARRRFDDDETFLRLRDQRSDAVQRLLQAIGSRASPSRRPSRPLPPGQSIIRRMYEFARRILGDKELPVRWRAFLTVWFAGRTLAARGYLPWVRQRQ
jgi:hypothetical protein